MHIAHGLAAARFDALRRDNPRIKHTAWLIFASPDGLGLEEPRIFVEVKHRTNTQIGAPEVRSFLGGRRPGDRCLYVSTGGFTRDAKSEAQRASVPLTLVDLRQLRELLVEYYEKLDPVTQQLVPLKRLYWAIESTE